MRDKPEYRRSTYVGLFDDRTAAEKAADRLRQQGFRDESIGYAWIGEREEAEEIREGATKGAAVGIVGGGALGAAAAAGLIPGVGPIVAGGILATALIGAGAGAAAGGLIGALAEMGVPEEEARYYDEEFRRGRTLMTVRAEDRYREASDAVRRSGGYDYETRADRPTVEDVEARRTP